MSAVDGGALAVADQLEIEAAYARACRALDFDEPEVYAALFTDAGSFARQTAAGEIAFKHVGSEELRGFAEQVTQRRAGLARHWITNVILDAEGDDRVRGFCYTMLVGTDAESHAVDISIAGTYHDSLVRTADGWRFEERVVVDDA
ncbi:MAG: nuclear transport factor 2 family protein [Solirubrobacterales bacterium]